MESRGSGHWSHYGIIRACPDFSDVSRKNGNRMISTIDENPKNWIVSNSPEIRSPDSHYKRLFESGIHTTLLIGPVSYSYRICFTSARIDSSIVLRCLEKDVNKSLQPFIILRSSHKPIIMFTVSRWVSPSSMAPPIARILAASVDFSGRRDLCDSHS